MVQPRTVVLGNSRAEIGFDPDDMAWPRAFRPVYNLALLGSGARTANRLLDPVFAANSPQLVVLGVDFMDFLTAPDAQAEESAGIARLLVTPTGQPNRWRWLQMLHDGASTLLSLDAVVHSLNTLRLRGKADVAHLTFAGFNPSNDYRQIARQEGYFNLFPTLEARLPIASVSTVLPSVSFPSRERCSSSPLAPPLFLLGVADRPERKHHESTTFLLCTESHDRLRLRRSGTELSPVLYDRFDPRSPEDHRQFRGIDVCRTDRDRLVNPDLAWHQGNLYAVDQNARLYTLDTSLCFATSTIMLTAGGSQISVEALASDGANLFISYGMGVTNTTMRWGNADPNTGSVTQIGSVEDTDGAGFDGSQFWTIDSFFTGNTSQNVFSAGYPVPATFAHAWGLG